jgi:hypothetical protein
LGAAPPRQEAAPGGLQVLRSGTTPTLDGYRNHPDESDDWKSLFGFGILSSVGLGFFTGGIQHFPDSPHRSLWVVPTGFVLSLVALYMLEGREKLGTRSFVIYALFGTALVIGGCIGAMEIIEHLGMTPHGHGH